MDQVSHKDGGLCGPRGLARVGVGSAHQHPSPAAAYSWLAELSSSSMPIPRAQLSSMGLPCFCLSDI